MRPWTDRKKRIKAQTHSLIDRLPGRKARTTLSPDSGERREKKTRNKALRLVSVRPFPPLSPRGVTITHSAITSFSKVAWLALS